MTAFPHRRLDGVALLLGLILALSAMEVARRALLVRLEDFAYGKETAGLQGGVDGRAIHCKDATDTSACETSYVAAGRGPAVLWLGNSMLAGINRFKPGDQNAPQLLHRALAERGRYLVAYAQPNANLMEHALVYRAVAHRFDTRLVLLPVVFDDLREQGIREPVADLMKDAESIRRLKTSAVWPIVKPLLPNGEYEAAGSQAKNETMQSRFEVAIDGWLSQHSTLWAARPMLRGTLSGAIHLLRNKVLGIRSYTKRKVDPTLYRERMALLDGLLGMMRKDGVDVLLYLPPYRTDIDGPYVAGEYARFKADLDELAGRHGVAYADFQDVVPGPEWATVTDHIFGFQEPDFMHFTALGHQRLSDQIDATLRRLER